MSKQQTAEHLKKQGNNYFNEKNFDEAINCYSKAIFKAPNVPVYFTNRALCYLKLKCWELTIQDCRRALDIDPNSVKGHYYLGQALLELELYDEAIKHLQRANDFKKGRKLNYGDDITNTLRLAKKKKYNIAEEKRIQQEIELQTYLTRLILEDKDRQIDDFRKLNSYEEVEDKIEDVEQKSDTYVAELNSLFSKVDERRRKREVPDYLCGKISFEIMKEPVITPSGITYDREDIEEHLQRVGHFDPVTRTPLTQDMLIPNLAMKEVVDAFLTENEWAIDY